MPTTPRLTRQDVLEYETYSSLLASWMFTNFLQELFGRYLAWKVASKLRRYNRWSLECQRVKAYANTR